jgi:hypothetical protein
MRLEGFKVLIAMFLLQEVFLLPLQESHPPARLFFPSEEGGFRELGASRRAGSRSEGVNLDEQGDC